MATIQSVDSDEELGTVSATSIGGADEESDLRIITEDHMDTSSVLKRRRRLKVGIAIGLVSVTIIGLLLLLILLRRRSHSLTFVVVGDWGRNGRFNQTVVAEQMGTYCATKVCAFVVSSGDNFYDKGVSSVDDPLWQTSFEQIYTAPSLQVPWHASLGNHDYMLNASAQVLYAQTHPNTRWHMPARYYTQPFGVEGVFSARLIVLDTSPFVASYRNDSEFKHSDVAEQNSTQQLQWLRNELSNAPTDWDIVIGHHPVYSAELREKHVSAETDMQTYIRPLLQQFQLPLYIAAHAHNLQIITPLDDVTNYVISGAGSKLRTEFEDPYPYPLWYSKENGFFAVEVFGMEAHLSAISWSGEVLQTIVVPKRPSVQK